MNLLLLFPDDLITSSTARVTGRRLDHARQVLRACIGGRIAAGFLNGRTGTATVTAIDDGAMELCFRLDRDPPTAVPVTVLLALPRPKVLRRVLYSLTVLGVKRIVLMNAARVEKSYWQSPFLTVEAVRHQLVRGLEQSRDTVLPEVVLKPRFKPFVEDELSGLAGGTLALVAHPGAENPCPCAVAGPVTLAIGPEGGFIPYEQELLAKQGFHAVSLGERTLHVEAAVHALIGRLMPDARNSEINRCSPV